MKRMIDKNPNDVAEFTEDRWAYAYGVTTFAIVVAFMGALGWSVGGVAAGAITALVTVLLIGLLLWLFP